MTTAADELLRLLDSLGESTLFCTAGKLTPVLPGLEVEGIGDVGVPVSAADAKRLIRQARQAPYGRGEETIVDTSVRRVWQLEPTQFSLQNTAWKPFVADIIETVRKEFGIPQKVEGQLYKLLIYEKGSFFAPHRDSEKAPGMFATLVVCLPSKHEGGMLILTHGGQTQRIAFGGRDAQFQIQYAAFYADCQHEVEPVTSGYRICLVYNLAIARKKQPSAPSSDDAVQAVADLLPKLFADKSRDKLAIPLEHQYTQAALAPGELKGADRARVDVLVRAAERLDYQVFLALMTHYQSGSADESSLEYDSYRSRRRYYNDYDDDEDGDSETSDDSGAEFMEITEESMSVDHWLDARGRPQPFGKLRLEESEIISRVAPEDRPYRQEIHEATGNEGVSMDRWYHQAVVVIWPRDRYFSILAGEGPDHAVPALAKLIAETKNPAADPGCAAFTAAIIARWNETGRAFRSRAPQDETSLAARMLQLLGRLGSVEPAVDFVRDILPDYSNGSEGPALARLINRLGWTHFAEPLRRLFARQAPEEYGRKLAPPVALFEALCCSAPKMTEERRAICGSLAVDLEQVFDRFNKAPRQAWLAREDQRTGIIERVFRALASVDDTARLDRFISEALADLKHYDLHAVLVPAVKALAGDAADCPRARPAWERLRDHCLSELRARTASKPEAPGDWRRDADLHCRCADCRELADFLQDPKQQVHRFQRRKELRQHLHRQIESHHCDVTHVTVRTGSPQTLVCTKTQATYERLLARFSLDLQLLCDLESLSKPDISAGNSPQKSRPTERKRR